MSQKEPTIWYGSDDHMACALGDNDDGTGCPGREAYVEKTAYDTLAQENEKLKSDMGLIVSNAGKDLIKERDELKAQLQMAVECLVKIENKIGKTMLAECCVETTCSPAYEDHVRVADCTHQYGVLRGFNECGYMARAVLEKLQKPDGENLR